MDLQSRRTFHLCHRHLHAFFHTDAYPSSAEEPRRLFAQRLQCTNGCVVHARLVTFSRRSLALLVLCTTLYVVPNGHCLCTRIPCETFHLLSYRPSLRVASTPLKLDHIPRVRTFCSFSDFEECVSNFLTAPALSISGNGPSSRHPHFTPTSTPPTTASASEILYPTLVVHLLEKIATTPHEVHGVKAISAPFTA